MRRSPRRVVPDLYRNPPLVRLSKEQFRRDLRNYFDSHQITNLEDLVIDDLFEIVKGGLLHLGLAQKVRTNKAQQDRKAIGHLIKILQGRVRGCLAVLANYEKKNLLTTRIVAKKLTREFGRLKGTLREAELQCRIQLEMVRMLKGTSYPGEISLAIDDYLGIFVSELRSHKERDIVTAGCLTAASLYPKRKSEDIVSAIPMQRSRGRKDYVAAQAMILGCPHCGFRYNIADLEGNASDTVLCKQCNQPFPTPFPSRKAEGKK